MLTRACAYALRALPYPSQHPTAKTEQPTKECTPDSRSSRVGHEGNEPYGVVGEMRLA